MEAREHRHLPGAERAWRALLHPRDRGIDRPARRRRTMSRTVVHAVDLCRCPELERCAALLDARERERLVRFATPLLRRRFAARRWALRVLLAGARGIAVERVELASEPGGCRRWADGGGPWFSTSHRGDTALIALSDAAGRLRGHDPPARAGGGGRGPPSPSELCPRRP